MRRLIPLPESGIGDIAPDDAAALAEVYAYPAAAATRTWLRANMVSSADGAAQLDGLSTGLSGAGDKRIFHVLRALADVILVGQNTVLQENYVPLREPEGDVADRRAAAGQAPVPAIAVVCDEPDRLDYRAPLFTEALVPTVVITTRRASAGRAWAKAVQVADGIVVSEPGREDQVDLRAAVVALAERGWTRVLCEGGPTLLAQLAVAGLLDELCLSVSPQVTAGPGKRITHGSVPGAPLHLQLAGLLEEDGFLFARYRADRARAGS
ncbi:pyrimidine reductase family protein [Streptomyces sp. NPDC004647]|uniref:pyrimidine reductase family protein n=1 Tax=Streptomyces sp. NPDC004647 TaxID=3154671 RepID=UPI0033A3E401